MAANGPKLNPRFDEDDDAAFAEDLTAISDFFAARSYQRYATVVALLTATADKDVDDLALAQDAPGARFRFIGAAWEMFGEARLADEAARSTVLPSPKNGWRARLLNTGLTYVYYELYHVTTMPTGRPSAGWYLDQPAEFHVREEQPSGTGGGTFTSGAWQKRLLNTTVRNEIGGASIASSAITLPAGTYEFMGWATAYLVEQNVLKIRQTSGTPVDLLIGSTEYSNVTQFQKSVVSGRVTLAAATTIELQHRCATTRAANGFGGAASFGVVEVYSNLQIRKVG